MFYNAKNCSLKIDDTQMDYITFGKGDKTLVMIPGLGDALKTVKGSAAAFALMYKLFAKTTGYMCSAAKQAETRLLHRDMAADLANAMNRLGITNALFWEFLRGGMIAQYLAIDFPEMVEKLVLAVTLCKQNETSKE